MGEHLLKPVLYSLRNRVGVVVIVPVFTSTIMVRYGKIYLNLTKAVFFTYSENFCPNSGNQEHSSYSCEAFCTQSTKSVPPTIPREPARLTKHDFPLVLVPANIFFNRKPSCFEDKCSNHWPIWSRIEILLNSFVRRGYFTVFGIYTQPSKFLITSSEF